VALTVFVAVSITDTVFDPRLVMYTFLPSGGTATPPGLRPTGIVALTVFVAVSITCTVLEISLVM
jgi:hypothetical protein